MTLFPASVGVRTLRSWGPTLRRSRLRGSGLGAPTLGNLRLQTSSDRAWLSTAPFDVRARNASSCGPHGVESPKGHGFEPKRSAKCLQVLLFGALRFRCFY